MAEQTESSKAEYHGDGQYNADIVAKHYNQLQESGREARTESRIFYMRNFNNWIKSVLIGETLQTLKKERGHRGIAVLDLCSGKGGDLLKWKKGDIARLVCTDIAGTSVEQSEVRYKEMLNRERHKDQVFTAEFITADCTKVRLREMYKDPNMKLDLCSCQFSFHYCFESLPQAQMMLQNAVENLQLGGYFIGSTPHAQELVHRLRESPDMSFGNEVYRVTFDLPDKENIPLFGAKYNFHLEGVVDCPEFLVFFPVLIKLAEEYGMKLRFKKTFADYFNEQIENQEHRVLLSRMQALEPYPPEKDTEPMGLKDTDYKSADEFLQEAQQRESSDDRYRSRPQKIGTLSKAEWEAITLYCVFAFQKVKDMKTGETWSGSEVLSVEGQEDVSSVDSKRKRPLDKASTSDVTEEDVSSEGVDSKRKRPLNEATPSDVIEEKVAKSS
ncbi:hypothetical protein CHS0354_018923 [Potamilus streckersoni]|uniref:mRNA (guanine-N(7))-methyltransferase n=1 Tax=Potamilus streckersoni TaxID=2493646 RepID=A0AAE0VH03_9BIVA|nr:hypothetical protein CHS0354_018923 [Potamilus streckersoni]